MDRVSESDSENINKFMEFALHQVSRNRDLPEYFGTGNFFTINVSILS